MTPLCKWPIRMPANMGLDILYKSVKFSYNHFRIDQNTPSPPPPKKFCSLPLFQSLVGITAVPKEIKKTMVMKKKGGKKVHCGLCEKCVLDLRPFHHLIEVLGPSNS